MDVMRNFCQASSLKVNLEKSKMISSAGVSRVRKRILQDLSDSKLVNNFDKYFGFPLTNSRIQKTDFDGVLEKIDRRIASWKASLLNKVGRLCLVKFVASSIPIYQMQNTWFPQSVCEAIDKKSRKFLWSGQSNHRSWHPISWRKVITPKKEGGLGVRESRCTNTSLMGKLVWDLLHKEDKFWVRVLKAKYLPFGSILSASKTANASPMWNGIIKAKDDIKDGFRFRLGPGDSSFWFTDWTGFGLLGDMVTFVHIQDLNLGVRDVIFADRWNFNSLHMFLSQEVLDKIPPFVPRLNGSPSGCWAWHAANHGIYSAASGYKWLLHNDFLPQTTPVDLGWVWKLTCPEKGLFSFNGSVDETGWVS